MMTLHGHSMPIHGSTALTGRACLACAAGQAARAEQQHGGHRRRRGGRGGRGGRATRAHDPNQEPWPSHGAALAGRAVAAAAATAADRRGDKQRAPQREWGVPRRPQPRRVAAEHAGQGALAFQLPGRRWQRRQRRVLCWQGAHPIADAKSIGLRTCPSCAATACLKGEAR